MLSILHPTATTIRMMFMSFDLGLCYFLRFNFELFFNIATFNLVDREMIFDIFSRVQLIVGIFMMFQLVMIIIKGIINPDTVSDSKTGGAGSMVMRIIVSLALLALIVPINIASPRNEYERQINNNGILFGTLYSLQYRILANDTIGRLVLGNESTNYTSKNPDSQKLSKFSDRFTTTIVKTFYTLNTDDSGKYVCNDGYDKVYNSNTDKPFDIIAEGAASCPISLHYHISMSYLIGTIAFAVLAVLMFMICFEVAKRVFQLAALQLLAPIPIISYMDPKGSKDGAFASWLKLLLTTYLELFIRLGVIYFALAIINKFSEKYFSVGAAVSTVKSTFDGAFLNAPQLIRWTFIIMCIALFIFAKDAPKFFKQMFGIKDNGKGFFSSFGTAMGLGVSAVGAVGSAVAGASSSRKADETRQSLGITDSHGKVIDPNSKANKAKHALAGLFGGVSGLTTGAGAALNAKDHNVKAAWDAMQKRNAAVLARGNDGSTLLGRAESTARSLFTGEGASGEIERQIATNKGRIDALKAIQTRVKSEMVKKDWTEGDLGIAVDNAGNDIGKVNYKDFSARVAAGRADGTGLVTFKDMKNVTHTINIGEAEKQLGYLMKTNENDYIERQINGKITTDIDHRFITLVRTADNLGGPDGGSSEFIRDDTDGTIKKGKNKKITDRDSIWQAIEGFEDLNVQLNQQNAIHKADDRYSGNNK